MTRDERRFHAACAALTGLLASNSNVKSVISEAFVYADAMLDKLDDMHKCKHVWNSDMRCLVCNTVK